jgi:hypothetical protein
MCIPVSLVAALRKHPRSVMFNLSEDNNGCIKVQWHTRKSGKYYKIHKYYVSPYLSVNSYSRILKLWNKGPGVYISRNQKKLWNTEM